MSKQTRYRDLSVTARVVIALSATLGVTLAVNSIAAYDWAQYAPFLGMLAVAVLTANTTVRLMGGSSLSLLTSVVLMSLISLGSDAAVLIGICGVIAQTTIPTRKLISYTLAFNVGMIGATVWLAGLAYKTFSIGGPSGPLIGLLAATLVYYLGNSTLVSMIVGLTTGRSTFRVWHDYFLFTAPAFFVAGTLAFATHEILDAVHFGVLLILLPILYLSYYSYRVYLENLENEKKHAEDMARLHGSTLETLVLAIDAKDRNHGHAIRVQKYARELARAMKLGDEDVDGIAAAGLLHDIGKLAVPDYILRKDGALTSEEMARMRLHPETGADIIANINFSYPVSAAVRHHHERFDGSGYPSGLQGEEIPLGARLLAVVDSCESYMSRHGSRAARAMAMIEKDSGTQFDPSIVAVWKTIFLDVTNSMAAAEEEAERSAPYLDIERSVSEVDVLDQLVETVSKMGTVQEIALAANRMLEAQIVSGTAVFWVPNGKEIVACGENEGSQRPLPIGAGVSGWVAAERTPCVNRTTNVGPCSGSRVVAVPVLFEDELLGVVSLYRGNPEFSDDEVRLVTATAERIAGNLKNAAVLEVARLDATSDRLTGLANRRALEKTFETMKHQPFSIALFDLNAFKAVNDTFGHQAGDDALVRIAEHLRSAFFGAIRSFLRTGRWGGESACDVICRLGGGEFLVASTEPPFAVHRSIREFLRLIAHDPQLERYKGLGFGVSWGVASSPEDGRNLNEVTAVADARMYDLKSRMNQQEQMPLPVEQSGT